MTREQIFFLGYYNTFNLVTFELISGNLIHDIKRIIMVQLLAMTLDYYNPSLS